MQMVWSMVLLSAQYALWTVTVPGLQLLQKGQYSSSVWTLLDFNEQYQISVFIRILILGFIVFHWRWEIYLCLKQHCTALQQQLTKPKSKMNGGGKNLWGAIIFFTHSWGSWFAGRGSIMRKKNYCSSEFVLILTKLETNTVPPHYHIGVW